MSTELELGTGALAPFERNGLMCSRRVLPWSLDGGPVAAWIAGNAIGCISFQAGPAAARLPYSTVDVNGVPWMGWDVGRHTPRPVAGYDREHGPVDDRCYYLDGMPCYYDGSSLQAFELLGRVVAAGSEDVLWDELAMYFRAWIADYGKDQS
jgi:hypothetical protein